MKSLIRLDPFRAIRTWDPFDELRTMQSEMDGLFNRWLFRPCRPLDPGMSPTYESA
jgi:hypothetical protein